MSDTNINSNISLNHQEFSIGHNDHPKDSYLHTKDGKVLTKYPYRTQFEHQLAEKIMDPERASFIAREFEKHITPEALSMYNGENVLHEWREALKYYAPLLGADSGYMLSTFKEHAHEEVRRFIENHPETAQKFFESIANREGKLNIGLNGKSKKVVILDSSSGGGHVATAQAIKTMVEKRGFQATIINQDELEKENDPLKFSGVKYKGEDITMAEVYNRVFQQDNDLETANKLWGIGNHVRQFLPNREAQRLAEKVRQIKPAMIFSVATHHPEHAALANMTGTPLKYVHTDFDFNDQLLPFADKVDKKLINFWVNAPDDEILQNKTMNGWTVPLQDLKEDGTIKVCGYPVRPSFVRETDPAKLDKIKESKGIPQDHQVALLAMGRQGIRDHILKYMKLLHDPNNVMEKPLHLVVVCGKNAELKKELEEYLAQLPPDQKNPDVHFKIEGFVPEKEMADYYKISNALISKPGGATAAEAAAMGVPLLSCHPHPWEIRNQEYLARHGLAESLESDYTFVDQLKRLMGRKDEGIAYKPLDWKKQFDTLMEDSTVKTKFALPKLQAPALIAKWAGWLFSQMPKMPQCDIASLKERNAVLISA